MSKNTTKIEKVLNSRGYSLLSAEWTPVGSECDMGGMDGGWEIEYGVNDVWEGIVWSYSTAEALEEIAKLPNLLEVDK